MHRATWEDVIARAGKNYLGDLQIDKPDGSVERGPVTGIRREHGMISFDMLWRARRESHHDDWENKHSNAVLVSEQCQVNFNSEGTLSFGNSAIGHFQVFQKHTAHLEPSAVHGLDNEEIRQTRAWMYDLPLDADWKTIVDRVVDDLGADGLTDAYEQIRVQQEATQFA